MQASGLSLPLDVWETAGARCHGVSCQPLVSGMPVTHLECLVALSDEALLVSEGNNLFDEQQLP